MPPVPPGPDKTHPFELVATQLLVGFETSVCQPPSPTIENGPGPTVAILVAPTQSNAAVASITTKKADTGRYELNNLI